ncbi:hypothetical protein Tco_0165108 [Tanacetum coccineum]
MSTRTKIGLGFKEYFGKDEVFDLSTPSVMYPEPVEVEVKPLYSWFVKAGEMHAVPPSITGTYLCDKSLDSETYASCDSSLKTKTKYFSPAVDIKALLESDVEDPNSTAGSPSFSCLGNVKSPRIFSKEDNMIQYLDKTKSLIQGFDRFTIRRQVPRGDRYKSDS